MEYIVNEPISQHMDWIDEDILAQLGALFTVLDPPSETLAEDTLFALSMASLDAELATLQETSLLAMRADVTTADSVTFTSSALQLMVSASSEGDALRVDGWITGGGLKVELISGATSYTAISDVHGRLVWDSVPRGRLRFLMHPANEDSRPVLTPVIEF